MTGKVFKIFFALSFLNPLGISLQAQAQKRHLVTFEDLDHFNDTESLALSPDGGKLAYTVEDTGKDNNLGLWLMDTRQGSRPRKIADGRFPVWAPDGRRLAYYSRESGSLQLWQFDLTSGERAQLTRLRGGIIPEYGTVRLGYSIFEAVRYAWSPDGSKIVFSSQVSIPPSMPRSTDAPRKLRKPITAIPLILTSDTPTDWTLEGVFAHGTTLQRQWHNGKQDNRESSSPHAVATTTQLFVVDLRSKETLQLTKGSLGYFSPDWSPDGEQIACISNEGHPLESYWVHTNVHLIRASDGQDSALTSDEIYKHTPAWSPDGRWISYIGTSTERLSKVSLLVVPSRGGDPIDATAKLDRRVFDAHWLPDSKTMVVNYMDGIDAPVARLNVMSGEHAVISGAGAAGRSFTFAASRSGMVAWTQSDPTNPGVIRVVPYNRNASYALLDLNPEIKNWDLPTQDVIHWTTQRGEERKGILLKPLGYQEGKRYPLIVDGYVRGNGFKGTAMEGNIALATRGYVVFWPNVEAPHDWVNPFESMANQEAAKGVNGLRLMFDDAMSGIDALISKGIVDPDRMCLYGFSNGGAVVNQLVTMTNRFKCAVSVAAALSGDWSRPFFLQTNAQFITDIAGATPWEDTQAYVKLSAIYRLDKVNTPILLADGDTDTMFLLGCIEMYNGLRFLKKDVTFLRYPGQGHGFDGAALKDFWERENIFFDKYLRPVR
jgi:dipeptidyl aminopeptidase/acylaminoacyl peptidase